MPRKKIVPIQSAVSGGDLGDVPSIEEKPRKAATKSASSSPRRNRKKLPGKAVVLSGHAAEIDEKAAAEILASMVSDEEQVALLAYSYWEARGRQGGSPEEDWYRAAQEIRKRSANAAQSRPN